MLRLSLSIFFLTIFSCNDQSSQGVVFSTSFQESTVKFCLTGDTGMRTELQKKMAQMIKQEKCDRIVILGDIIYPDGIASAFDKQIKTKFEDFYYPLTTIDKRPQIALINGNHDYHGNAKAWTEVAKMRPWLIMPSLYYMENVHGFCFYYLDSPMLLALKAEASSQVEWFKNIRNKMGDKCRTEIVLTHHPYLSDGRYSDVTGPLKEIYDSLIVNQADFLISGHSHILKDLGKIGKTQFIISGTGGEVYEGFQAGLLVLELGLSDHSIKYLLKVNNNL